MKTKTKKKKGGAASVRCKECAHLRKERDEWEESSNAELRKQIDYLQKEVVKLRQGLLDEIQAGMTKTKFPELDPQLKAGRP